MRFKYILVSLISIVFIACENNDNKNEISLKEILTSSKEWYLVEDNKSKVFNFTENTWNIKEYNNSTFNEPVVNNVSLNISFYYGGNDLKTINEKDSLECTLEYRGIECVNIICTNLNTQLAIDYNLFKNKEDVFDMNGTCIKN